MIRKTHLAAGLVTSLLAAPLAAATPPLAVTVPSAMPLAAVGISQTACTVPSAPAPALLAVPLNARMMKSAAILGGQMSALERMKLEQSGQLALAAAAPAPVAPPVALSAAQARACDMLGAGKPAAASLAVNTVTGDMQHRWGGGLQTGRFLGTERIAIGRTRFDASWERVAAAELTMGEAERALGTLAQDRTQLMAQVNGWVNKAITYRRDSALFGRRDYWADARSTLARRAGDCEDYAILKLQLLAAAGVAREDMMLTLARDTLRRSDHAVLLVRDEGEWFMLDMASDRVANAAADYGYRPLMSFTGSERFIHGTPTGELGPRTTRLALAD
ncbi:transglutaminase-like cysteine peptidase [Altererythrobacter sp. BO-6]|uniref:transglutaminase-like cysteine peptidase n=1 Tax=Altererythrobacter sp. BO-6 TaxID=2604537 RepID=UPI0013E1B6A4|nr:transglutaminase-like cysteine peptidase [Altererythrobacter sp. BO-6]QIG55111.1 transglutaminase-like cysteine peptidase [Altererythrobacter sp. BO-6]